MLNAPLTPPPFLMPSPHAAPAVNANFWDIKALVDYGHSKVGGICRQDLWFMCCYDPISVAEGEPHAPNGVLAY